MSSDISVVDTSEYVFKEEIIITNAVLHINLYGSGAKGNIFCSYKYSGKDLLLTGIESYSQGAGGSETIKYLPQEGKIILETINMMEVDTSPIIKTILYGKRRFPIEKTNPETLLKEIGSFIAK